MLAAVEGPVLVHPLADLRPPSSWHHGRVALLGDAAHAMTPNLGQGAAQAFVDAVVLAEEAREDPASLAAYERRRRRAAESVARRSRRTGDVAAWRSPVAVAVRNALVAAVPARASAAALDRLLGTPETRRIPTAHRAGPGRGTGHAELVHRGPGTGEEPAVVAGRMAG